jgi:M3 family oligoendopeptidase
MLKFKDYLYERPDVDKLTRQFEELFQNFEGAATVEIQNQSISKINELRSEFESMATIVEIRYSINTNDEYYEKEQEFVDEVKPIYDGLIAKYYGLLVKSKFRNELEEIWGKQIFRIAELKQKTFSEEIVEDLQKENKLVSKYAKLSASAKIFFEGEERNLSQMIPFTMAKDRNVRRQADGAVTNFFVEHEAEYDSIYDELVGLRHTIAKKLGFNNFIELGYARMTRSDYNAKMVANYRKQVKDNIIPVATELKKRQQQRLGLTEFKNYDEKLMFLTGNPTPRGNEDFMIETGKKMYKELSPETHEFFSFMVENELLDLTAKKGKSGGGYCTYINKYKAPFIFSNFNGTSGDVDVLTHEAGHAFQSYESRNFQIPEYLYPTMEACEIHSMSMEFFAWPWMKAFFGEDELKYKFSHLSEALTFIPYGVLVDEFQHWVYENPEASKGERKKAWSSLEKTYLPHRDNGDNEFLNRGGYWFRQGHIFFQPFYYIDYTLAQVCALQFWVKLNKDRSAAWEEYLRLCKAGGSKSFLELVKYANLNNPFEDGCIESIIEPIKEWLKGVDDMTL